MIQNGLILTGNDAELLSNALEVVKAKFYEKSETNLDDTQALDAIVSCFRTREKKDREKETHHMPRKPLQALHRCYCAEKSLSLLPRVFRLI